MATAEQEAKQLDSVTDHVQDQEYDEAKAKAGLLALTGGCVQGAEASSELKTIAVSKEDVALIVSELEVSEEVAARALREVEGQGTSAVAEALRRLVTS